jgi:hypothetical protein
LLQFCGHLDTDLCGRKVNTAVRASTVSSGSGVNPKATEECGSVECQKVKIFCTISGKPCLSSLIVVCSLRARIIEF